MKKKNVGTSVLNVLVYILCFIWLVPIIWMMVVAIKPESEDTTKIINWFTGSFTLENIKQVFNHPQANVTVWMKNSLIVAVLVTVVSITLAALAAFAISRIPFKGKGIIFIIIMIGMMVPREATLLPLYSLCIDLEISNTYFAIIAPSLAAPFGVIILKNFFDGIPDALFEAATIDGCSWYKQLMIIGIPLAKSAVSSLAILIFMQGWNDFLWPFISITDPEKVTIPVGLPLFRSQYMTGMGLTMAAGAILALPIIIAFIFLQKYIVASVASAGIKG